MTRGASCESDLSLDLLLAGDLSQGEERRVHAHLAACRPCAARWTELEAQRDAFTVQPVIDLGGRRPARRSWLRSWPVPAAAIAAAAALLLVLWPVGAPMTDRVVTTRTKGGRVFNAYIRHGESIRKAGDAEVVYPGDQLQFTYSSPRSGFVAVLSRDGAGMASVYFPDAGQRPWTAPPGDDQPLPRSTILDDTLGQERVHALFCTAVVDLESLRGELAAGRPLRVPPGCVVETTLLNKRAAE